MNQNQVLIKTICNACGGEGVLSSTLDVYGHLIASNQNKMAELIDELVIPMAVQLDEKVEP
jgi:hypothetical protein